MDIYKKYSNEYMNEYLGSGIPNEIKTGESITPKVTHEYTAAGLQPGYPNNIIYNI